MTLADTEERQLVTTVTLTEAGESHSSHTDGHEVTPHVTHFPSSSGGHQEQVTALSLLRDTSHTQKKLDKSRCTVFCFIKKMGFCFSS